MCKIILIVRMTAKFDEIFKVTSVSFFIPDFDLITCKLNTLRSKCYIKSCYTDIMLKQNIIVEHSVGKSNDYVHNILTILSEKYKMVSFASSTIKKIFVFLSRSTFAVKLICCIAFGSPSSSFCLLKSIAIIL